MPSKLVKADQNISKFNRNIGRMSCKVSNHMRSLLLILTCSDSWMTTCIAPDSDGEVSLCWPPHHRLSQNKNVPRKSCRIRKEQRARLTPLPKRYIAMNDRNISETLADCPLHISCVNKKPQVSKNKSLGLGLRLTRSRAWCWRRRKMMERWKKSGESWRWRSICTRSSPL